MKNKLNAQAIQPELAIEAVLAEMVADAADCTQQFDALLDEMNAKQVLAPKLVRLINLIIDVTATHLYAPGVRRHIHHALNMGISQAEILEVFKLASVVGIHSCALGVPILQAEMAALGIEAPIATAVATPICDELRAKGQFNPLWETLYLWDAQYLESFLSMATEVWRNNILPALWIELLCIAGDAAITHLWAPGIKRHMHAALTVGATPLQILEVLKLVSLQGIQSCELGSSILDEVLSEYAEA